jgi:hypothetical protein
MRAKILPTPWEKEEGEQSKIFLPVLYVFGSERFAVVARS